MLLFLDSSASSESNRKSPLKFPIISVVDKGYHEQYLIKTIAAFRKRFYTYLDRLEIYLWDPKGLHKSGKLSFCWRQLFLLNLCKKFCSHMSVVVATKSSLRFCYFLTEFFLDLLFFHLSFICNTSNLLFQINGSIHVVGIFQNFISSCYIYIHAQSLLRSNDTGHSVLL